jgi:hypothetical protein
MFLVPFVVPKNQGEIYGRSRGAAEDGGLGRKGTEYEG